MMPGLAPARALACVPPPELLVVERLLRGPGLLPPGRLDRACAVQSGRVCLETRLSRHASRQLRRSIDVGHILHMFNNLTTSFLVEKFLNLKGGASLESGVAGDRCGVGSDVTVFPRSPGAGEMRVRVGAVPAVSEDIRKTFTN